MLGGMKGPCMANFVAYDNKGVLDIFLNKNVTSYSHFLMV